MELRHPDVDVLEQASTDLAEVLPTYPGVWDINDDDGTSAGAAVPQPAE